MCFADDTENSNSLMCGGKFGSQFGGYNSKHQITSMDQPGTW